MRVQFRWGVLVRKALYHLTDSSGLRRQLRNCRTILTTRWISLRLQCRKWNTSFRIDLRAVLVILITTLLISYLNKSWRRFGGSTRTANCRRKEHRKKHGSWWTNGGRLEAGSKRRFREKKNIRMQPPTLRKQGGSSGLTGNQKISIRRWTPPCSTAPLTRARSKRGKN